eukprot:g4906.t1
MGWHTSIVSRFVDRCVRPRASRAVILLLALIVVVLGALFSKKFLNACDSKIDPPKHTQAYDARDAASARFPDFATSKSMVVYVTSSSSSSLISGSLYAELTSLSETFCSSLLTSVGSDKLTSCASFSELCAANLPNTASLVVAPTGCAEDCAAVPGSPCTSAVINVEMTSSWTNDDTSTATSLLDVALGPNENLRATLTGNEVFYYAGQSMISETLHTMDTISLPIAVLVVWGTLGNVRMLIVLGANILVTLTLSFAVMYPIAEATTVYTTVPSMMMSVVIAMSIDYSLFLLARFQEEVRKTPKDVRRVVFAMLDHAGYNVFVSGTCLMLCFAGLLCFPVTLIFSLGLGAAVAVLSAIVVNLTITPVVLYSFPEFFADDRYAGLVCVVAAWARIRAWVSVGGGGGDGAGVGVDDGSDDGSDALLGLSPPAVAAITAPTPPPSPPTRRPPPPTLSQRVYGAVGSFATRWPYNLLVILVAVALSSPAIAYFPSMETSISYRYYTDKSAASTRAFSDLLETFGEGSANPFMLLVVPKDLSDLPANVTATDAYFKDMQNLTAQIETFRPKISGASTFASPYRVSGQNVPRELYVGCKVFVEEEKKGGAEKSDGDEIAPPSCTELERLYRTQTSRDGIASYAQIRIAGTDPFSLEGETWIDDFRDDLKREVNWSFLSREYDLYLTRGTVDLHDSRKLTFSLFPYLVAIVLGVAFGFVGLSFRTIVVPARAVVTISLTLSWVFGMLVLTYQYGIFDWTGASQLSNMDGIFWLSPIIAFAVCVGLGLDYDIFLLERIHDNRERGMGEIEAVTDGLKRTGGIIGSAGLVMLASFGGLLFSVNPGLSQIGFMLCFAVWADTFVVEPFLVPAFMGLIGKWNWWPGLRNEEEGTGGDGGAASAYEKLGCGSEGAGGAAVSDEEAAVGAEEDVMRTSLF